MAPLSKQTLMALPPDEGIRGSTGLGLYDSGVPRKFLAVYLRIRRAAQEFALACASQKLVAVDHHPAP